jgi:hypothetical protein
MTVDLKEKQEVDTSKKEDHFHQFHAEGNALKGAVRAPIKQDIETQIPVELNDRRGGHLTRTVSNVSIEGLVSIKRAETRVSGSMIKGKYVTLATTIVEGLKVFEVLTVDRVISQVSTSHAVENGHVPKVTFLGSNFENLQVCGIPVKITYNFGVCPAPQNNETYLANKAFVRATRDWTETILNKDGLFGNARAENEHRNVKVSEVLSVIQADDYQKLKSDEKVATLRTLFPDDRPRITCSLVKSIDIAKIREQLPRVETVGHVLIIPDFGVVSLGEIEVGLEQPKPPRYSVPGVQNGSSSKSSKELSNYFELTMLNMELGCIADASMKSAQSKNNGTTSP